MAAIFGIIRIELPDGTVFARPQDKTQTYERNDPK